ncbi:MAG: EamA family transporter [Bacteroidota bacterium]
MPTNKLKNQIHLHFIVFIWGFTAILAALISIDAIPLVWYRVMLASITLFLYFKIKKIKFKISFDAFLRFLLGGIIIALHWVAFFYAIKISTISITLITMSSSAIFVALLDPLFSKKKFRFYELLLASIVIIGFIIIFKVENGYTKGIISALISSVLLAFFSIFNSKNIQKYNAVHIAFYELLTAFLFLSLVMLLSNTISFDTIKMTTSDWLYLIILSTVCTAYPFVIATNLLKKMSPFTIILTNNLEPVYGIILAVIIFGDKEKMSVQFYIGAAIILGSVILNGILKAKKN